MSLERRDLYVGLVGKRFTLLVSNNGSGFGVELVPSIDLASNSVGDRFFTKRGEPFRQEKGHVGTD